jgi:hypothetical protein
MKLYQLAMVVIAALGLIGITQAEEKSIALDKLPAKIVEAIKKKYPTAEMISATTEKDEEDEDKFEVLVKVNGQKIDVTIDEDGDIEGLEKEIPAAELPAPVSATVKKESPTGVIQTVEAIYEIDDSKEDLEYFEVTVKVGDKESELLINPDGSIHVEEKESDEVAFTSDYSGDKDQLASTGKNPYFVLEPGYQLSYENKDEKLTITVLPDTRVVDGVETRIVEERETKNGQMVEISRNFFAISKRTNNVYYFGEEVDMYKDGKVSTHEGSWQSGKDGAKFGLAIPGLPLLGSRYQQEVAPKTAMDQVTVASVSDKVTVPAGTFEHCVKVEETTPLEPGVKEYKTYAPGVGLILDGDLKLVKFGKATAP